MVAIITKFDSLAQDVMQEIEEAAEEEEEDPLEVLLQGDFQNNLDEIIHYINQYDEDEEVKEGKEGKEAAQGDQGDQDR